MSAPTVPQTISPSQVNKETPISEDLQALSHQSVYGYRPATSSGLTFGYHAGRWGGFDVPEDDLTLTASNTNYIVVERSTGVVSTSTSNTNWNNTTTYARVYKVTTDGSGVTNLYGSDFDYRSGPGGVHGQSASTGQVVVIPIAVSDETTALTTGTAKVTFRMPFAMTLTAVRSSVTTAPTGSALVVDINEGGSTILSTKLSIDASEKTSTTAATPAVISDTALADDAEITIDIDQVGSTVAGAGLKVYLIGML